MRKYIPSRTLRVTSFVCLLLIVGLILETVNIFFYRLVEAKSELNTSASTPDGLDLLDSPPEIVSFNLTQSQDKIYWSTISGDSMNGFIMPLNPSVDYYYLNAANVVTNKPFKPDLHGFYLDTYPPGFLQYWESRGVDSNAQPGTWQAWMWEIINGQQPIFYLKVMDITAGQSFMLVDGLHYDYFGVEDFLRVNGGYHLGDYTYQGLIEDKFGNTNTQTFSINFQDLPRIEDLELSWSLDKSTWDQAYGDLSPGFLLSLDPFKEYYYVNVIGVVTNKELQVTYQPFFLSSFPDELLSYWDAQGVNADARPGTWQAWMWDILNAQEPYFYLKVTAGSITQEFSLVDGLQRDFELFEVEDFLRFRGDYPPGIYIFSGEIKDKVGGSNAISLDITLREMAKILDLTLMQSTDKADWQPAAGNIINGFGMALEPQIPFHYLDVKDVIANKDLELDYHPFFLETYPDDFLTYWNAKGVNANALPGTWQAWMWEIIQGNQPIFYLKVSQGTSGQEFVLIDGLQRDYEPIGIEDYLRVNGDYPLGSYIFSGLLEQSEYGDAVQFVSITFEEPPQILSFDLLQSEDQSSWRAAFGSLSEGFTLNLDPEVLFFYLNVENILSNKELKETYHPFYVENYPANFFSYWDASGVNADALPGTWQAWMWEIIQGNQPIFYLKASAGQEGQEFKLVDGLQWDFLSVENFLRINGDYPIGDYSYSGIIKDKVEGSFELVVNVAVVDTVFSENYFPIVRVNSPEMPADTIFGVEMNDITVSGGLEMMDSAGANYIRHNYLEGGNVDGLVWAAVEPNKGDRNWDAISAMDQQLINAAQRGMQVILIVRSTPQWASLYEDPANPLEKSACGPIKPEEYAAFGDFLYDTVERYSAAPYNVMYWELYNEPDYPIVFGNLPYGVPLGCWGTYLQPGTTDPYNNGMAYGEMLKVVYPRIKQADPDAQVLLGGLLLDCDPRKPAPDELSICEQFDPPHSTVQPKFFEGILAAGASDSFDGVSYHAYDYYAGEYGTYFLPTWGSTWDTSGLGMTAKAGYIRELMGAYSVFGKYLLCTECAILGTPWNWIDQDTKAAYLVHSYTTAFALNLRANIWYNVFGWRNSGLLKYDLTPYAAYYTFQFAVQKLGAATYSHEVTEFPGARVYAFQKDGKNLWVAWSVNGPEQVITLPTSPSGIWDMYGVAQETSGNTITVKFAPYYIEF